MLNKNNIDLGLIFLENLMEFFGYSDKTDNTLFTSGIKKAIDIYRYMNNIYLESLKKMEMDESKKILLELETILNKISKLINAINNDADTNLIEELRLERNHLMESKIKLMKAELKKQKVKEHKDAN
ncbi:BlyB family putative holin accessory protein [Borrelia persica]|uniref:BlyB family putative holin accessory protein n=1 Tax=Borrelia persica TaxID=44448 RepID=UPI000464C5C6|nr:BlyB family putative holin accessory protein [Borrelia persica]